MSDRKFTLLEVHLDGDAQFGPRSIGEEAESEDESAPERPETSVVEREERAGLLGPALKALAVVAVLLGGAKLAGELAGRLSGDAAPAIEVESEDEDVEASAN